MKRKFMKTFLIYAGRQHQEVIDAMTVEAARRYADDFYGQNGYWLHFGACSCRRFDRECEDLQEGCVVYENHSME